MKQNVLLISVFVTIFMFMGGTYDSLQVNAIQWMVLIGKPFCSPERTKEIIDETLRCLGHDPEKVKVPLIVFMREPKYVGAFGRGGWEQETYFSGQKVDSKIVMGYAYGLFTRGGPAVIEVSRDLGALVHEVIHVHRHLFGHWGEMTDHDDKDFKRCSKVVILCKPREWPHAENR